MGDSMDGPSYEARRGELGAVLIVDDEVTDRETVGRYIRPGFELYEARTLAEGHACVAEREFACILLDRELPDANGCEHISTFTQHAPVIVMSGYDNPDAIAEAIARGATDYLVKDEVDAATLRRCILTAVYRHRYTGSDGLNPEQAASGEPEAVVPAAVSGLRELRSPLKKLNAALFRLTSSRRLDGPEISTVDEGRTAVSEMEDIVQRMESLLKTDH